ncbi:MAG: multifunctional CCA tRNA nucleotidyl transferase/2'3'-cyclic phosphodiesterase/2'nucleotidase/phosphatase [Gammaproteobacteria bacterium]
MKIYLVGGAVRDQMLGLPVKEKDWVVVGATVDDMLRRGFRPVGKDFPVFLHPETKEEYALARIERKIGRGYTGFDFNASPKVTLEEDLQRRDLTINAMAQTPDGVLVDPYHGQDDLEKKILRHVSSAFVEDPVRILRVARFAARYAELGFKVAPETNALMKEMVVSGEVDALVPERVWKELERALGEKNPEQFFQTLADCDALSALFPELNMNSAGMRALVRATKLTNDAQIRFAVLLHDVPESQIKSLCERYRVPSDYRELALLLARHFKDFPLDTQLIPENAEKIVAYFSAVDAYRREERFRKFLAACEVILSAEKLTDISYLFQEVVRKASPLLSKEISNKAILWECYLAAKAVDAKEFLNAGYAGKELQEPIREKRVMLVEEILKSKMQK